MGHYASEMGYGELTKEEIEYNKKKAKLEKQICKILKVKSGELKIVAKILKDAWMTPDNYD